MPIQAPPWTDYLNCPACCREFTQQRSPVSLGCGHTLCRICLKNLHRKQCPFDQSQITLDLEDLVVNTALFQLAGYTPPSQPYHPPCIRALGEQDRRAYDVIIKCLEQLAVFLKFCGNVSASVNVLGSRLSRPMQRKLVILLQCAVTDEEGRGKLVRAARSLGERTVTELILQHQNPQQLSANLWAAVRARGCQFLGPSMQEEVLKLVLLALEDGSALSRKVLVMFVVQRLEPHFPQASKTSIGHVVQLLYRASCFKVSKRESDSSLMQLKEEFRTYETLRREHDAQIVQIATEAGLRIAPDQWSALLYGDPQHKSHMQSIIDKLQTPQSFSQSVQELFIALQRTGDPTQLIVMSIPLDRLANIDASPDAKSPTWQQLSDIMTSLKEVVSGLVQYMHHVTSGRDVNHNAKISDRQAEPPVQQSTIPAGMVPNRYKVAMCRDAQARTYCPRGNSCTYAHSEEELERYRRINSGANNGNYQYLIPVPAIAVVRPIYQRFSVPPPSLPSMNNNYNMPPMKQQISPAARRSMIRADTPKRDQSYDNLYEHPPPNVSANNFVGSYANALMHGGSNGMANQNSQQQNQNGTVNSMMPPPGCYIPRYPTDRGTAYAPRPHTDAGRISNDEASQYPGMGAPIGAGGDQNGPGLHFEPLPRATASHPSAIAPPQEPAWPNNKSSLTKMKPMFEFTEKAKNLPPGMEVGSQMQIGEYGNKMPIGEYGKNMPIGMPKTNGEMKHGPMFEFNERAKNLPPGMEAGSKMTIGDYGKKQSIGDYGSKMPIGEYGSKMPIGEYGKNMPIGMEMTNNLPINSNLPIGNNLHGIGMPQTNSDMMHHGMEIVRMKPKALSTETEKRYDQELEKDLRALEQRISTEFCKISDPLEKKLLMNLTPSV